MPGCPTCGAPRDSWQKLRVHHQSAHGESLPTRECERCGERFYCGHPRKYFTEACREECRNPDHTGANNPNYSGAKETTECKLPTTEVVGVPPQGVLAHASAAAEGGVHDGGAVTRRGFLRGVPPRGLRPKPSHTGLIIGGIPSFHRRVIRRERRGVIRPRCQGVVTNAPPRSTRLANQECARRYRTREHTSNGSDPGVLSPEELIEPVGFLSRLNVVGFCLELL